MSLAITQYTDVSRTGTVVDTAGAAVNITGASLSVSLRHKVSDAVTTFSGSVVSGAAGTFAVGITDAQTAALQPGDYDAEFTMKIGTATSKSETFAAEVLSAVNPSATP